MLPPIMLRFTSLASSFVLLSACVFTDKPDPSASEGSSSSGATSSGATDTEGATGTSGGTDASASSTGGTSGTSGTTHTTHTSNTATDATTTTTTGPDTTTGGLVCDLEPLVEAAATVMGPVKDCGIVDPWNNTVEDWKAAVTCALDAAGAEVPFKMIAWRMGIDSKVGSGYFGVAAESYARGTIDYDSFEPGSALQRTCLALVATPGCMVDLGEPCITCEGASEGVQLCE